MALLTEWPWLWDGVRTFLRHRAMLERQNIECRVGHEERAAERLSPGVAERVHPQ